MSAVPKKRCRVGSFAAHAFLDQIIFRVGSKAAHPTHTLLSLVSR